MAWLFLFIISATAFIPKADLSQLRLLNSLYAHFLMYHANDEQQPGLPDFLDFIVQHYGSMQHEHPDENEHEQLPFKNFTSGSFFIASQIEKLSVIVVFFESDDYLPLIDSCSEGFSATIDHPPAS